jgi:hypothetical protein
MKSTRQPITASGLSQSKREEFLKAVFSKYKKHAYKVKFKNDNVFYLGGNQRAKLQYNILAYHFDLVSVSEEDKADLERLCANYDGETAGRWLNRMVWEQGHEKMITFGVALEVRREDGTARANGVWCYSAEITSKGAVYTGTPMTWERWGAALIIHLDGKREEYKDNKAEKYNAVYKETARLMYYQNGNYMTLTAKERGAISDWIYEYYFSSRKPPLPLPGEIPNGDLQFTVDFENDVELVKAYDLKTEMGAFNKEHNDRRNKDMGRNKSKDRFEELEGDTWTTQEILSQGFSRKTLDTFVRHGFIKRIKQGHYVRNSV